MNTFEEIVKPNQYFYYQRGSVFTEKPWNRPNYNTLKEFLTVISEKTDILSRYQIYLMGGVLFDFEKTWDVDLCFTGKIESYDILENDMNLMYDVALNHFRLLLDIQWFIDPLPVVSYEEITSSEFKHYRLKYIKTGYVKKQVGQEVTIKDIRDENGITKLSTYLVEGYHNEYPGTKEKVINRIKQNPHKVLKSVFNVETFLNSDEDYFIYNTNRN